MSYTILHTQGEEGKYNARNGNTAVVDDDAFAGEFYLLRTNDVIIFGGHNLWLEVSIDDSKAFWEG